MSYSRQQLENLTLSAAAQYGIDPSIAYWQIQAESNWNPNAVSSAGAQGLAQFMPATWAEWGRGSPFDPVAALDAYGRYMRWLLGRVGWDYAKALAAYNWGIGRVESAVRERGDAWITKAPTETRNYVERILSRASLSPVGTDAPFGAGDMDAMTLAVITVGIIALIWAAAR